MSGLKLAFILTTVGREIVGAKAECTLCLSSQFGVTQVRQTQPQNSYHLDFNHVPSSGMAPFPLLYKSIFESPVQPCFLHMPPPATGTWEAARQCGTQLNISQGRETHLRTVKMLCMLPCGTLASAVPSAPPKESLAGK